MLVEQIFRSLEAWWDIFAAAYTSSVTVTVTATARDSHYFELSPPLTLSLREILAISLYQHSQIHLKFGELKVLLNSLQLLLVIADERPH
ncbi:hypothetical protein VE02_06474 [Pseudogymnoascus sp. 03VT05]|nr:hypothetical protein VE02_06474 [Pseudogymnoascus sp. 03VT05]